MNSSWLAGNAHDARASHIAFTWLLHLRWGVICCQVLVIALVAALLRIALPVPILVVLLSFQVASNCCFRLLQKRRIAMHQWLFGLVMAWDILHLALLVHYTGGPMNPFTFLFLAHVALAALLMESAWAWGLAGLTICCYAAIFYVTPAGFFGVGMGGGPVSLCEPDMNMHLQGMWVAYAITALFIVFYAGKIQQALSVHQDTVNRLQREKDRSEKLASLAALAAGAAHELATPLSTIAVAANEMGHALQNADVDRELREDAGLIRRQVQRCKDILQQMSADAGEQQGGVFVTVSLAGLLTQVVREFKREKDGHVQLQVTGRTVLKLPLQNWLRALKGLLRNAYDAAPDNEILVRGWEEETELCIAVQDHGPGMDRQTLERVAEPFFTTKGAGNGLGLGVFLAQSLAERYGGSLHFESSPGTGTTVLFRVPLEQISCRRQER